MIYMELIDLNLNQIITEFIKKEQTIKTEFLIDHIMETTGNYDFDYLLDYSKDEQFNLNLKFRMGVGSNRIYGKWAILQYVEKKPEYIPPWKR